MQDFVVQNTKRLKQYQRLLQSELILMDVEQVTRQQVFSDQQSYEMGGGTLPPPSEYSTAMKILQHYLLAMFQFSSLVRLFIYPRQSFVQEILGCFFYIDLLLNLWLSVQFFHKLDKKHCIFFFFF